MSRRLISGVDDRVAVRDDVSQNLDALAQLMTKVGPDLLVVESGGDNLALFSRDLADFTIYVTDVSRGDKIPREGGPGITQSDLLVFNKTDLAPLVCRRPRGPGAGRSPYARRPSGRLCTSDRQGWRERHRRHRQSRLGSQRRPLNPTSNSTYSIPMRQQRLAWCRVLNLPGRLNHRILLVWRCCGSTHLSLYQTVLEYPQSYYLHLQNIFSVGYLLHSGNPNLLRSGLAADTRGHRRGPGSPTETTTYRDCD